MEPDSTVLMCSDGLSNMVEDSKIERTHWTRRGISPTGETF